MVFAYFNILLIVFNWSRVSVCDSVNELSSALFYFIQCSLIAPNPWVCVFHFGSAFYLTIWRASFFCFVFLMLLRQVLSSLFIFEWFFFSSYFTKGSSRDILIEGIVRRLTCALKNSTRVLVLPGERGRGSGESRPVAHLYLVFCVCVWRRKECWVRKWGREGALGGPEALSWVAG